jgi:hypothetical protein
LLCDLERHACGRRASCLKINIKGGNYAALHLWLHAGFESHMRASQMYYKLLSAYASNACLYNLETLPPCFAASCLYCVSSSGCITNLTCERCPILGRL